MNIIKKEIIIKNKIKFKSKKSKIIKLSFNKNQ
jgi:hypothetical protein